jgi:hypothetical protein
MSAGDAATAHEHSAPLSFTNDQKSRLPISKPCNGPYCRSAPFQPLPASPVSVSPQSDRSALFGHADLQLTTREQYHFAGEPNACSMPGFKVRIEHPPRV